VLFFLIIPLQGSAQADPKKYKLQEGQCEDPKLLKKFCVSKGFQGHILSGNVKHGCYVVCSKSTDSGLDLKGVIPLADEVTHNVNEHLTPAVEECRTPIASENSGNKLPSNGFSALLKDLERGENYCVLDRGYVKKQALAVMNETLAHYYGLPVDSSDEKFKDDIKNDDHFKKLMMDRWKIIFDQLEHRDQTYQRRFVSKGTGLERVKNSLNFGFIPLPTITDLATDGSNLFTFTNLSKYFYMGIAPVNIAKKSDLDISRIEAHPLTSAGLVNGELNFAVHDMGHTYEGLALNFAQLKIFDTEKCQKLQSCLNNLILPKKEDKRVYNRIMLFYLIHEEENNLLSRYMKEKTFGGFMDKVTKDFFIEFALERVLSK
jgi:hypothetical protein